MNHGLSKNVVERIQGVFKAHPEVGKAVLYGSRANGTHRSGSDIDITLFGSTLDDRVLASVENELDELFLPYAFDLSNFSLLTHPALRDHIRRVGFVLYEKARTAEAVLAG